MPIICYDPKLKTLKTKLENYCKNYEEYKTILLSRFDVVRFKNERINKV